MKGLCCDTSEVGLLFFLLRLGPRDGVKIGESRRFSVLVVDGALPDPPEALVKFQDDFYKEDDTVSYVLLNFEMFGLCHCDIGTNVTLSTEAVNFRNWY